MWRKEFAAFLALKRLMLLKGTTRTLRTTLSKNTTGTLDRWITYLKITHYCFFSLCFSFSCFWGTNVLTYMFYISKLQLKDDFTE